MLFIFLERPYYRSLRNAAVHRMPGTGGCAGSNPAPGDFFLFCGYCKAGQLSRFRGVGGVGLNFHASMHSPDRVDGTLQWGTIVDGTLQWGTINAGISHGGHVIRHNYWMSAS